MDEDRWVGCLLGAAIGDALGMSCEGRSAEEISREGGGVDFLPSASTAPMLIPVGDLGVSEFEDLLQAGQWTDDTQLLLALTESLIEEQGLLVPEAWGHYIVRWLNEAPRGPGLSSLQTAIQLRTGGVTWEEASDLEGAGCNAASRVAPVGLLYADDAEKRRFASVLQAQVTHGHPDAQAAAFAVAEAVALAVTLPADNEWDGETFLTMLIDRTQAASPHYTEFARCLELARTLLLDKIAPETAIRVLGVSAWSREAVPAALYCAAIGGSGFEQTLTQTVQRTGGAVDSIAAIVGAVAGARCGREAIPERWRSGVEDHERIVHLAEMLFSLRGSAQP